MAWKYSWLTKIKSLTWKTYVLNTHYWKYKGLSENVLNICFWKKILNTTDYFCSKSFCTQYVICINNNQTTREKKNKCEICLKLLIIKHARIYRSVKCQYYKITRHLSILAYKFLLKKNNLAVQITCNITVSNLSQDKFQQHILHKAIFSIYVPFKMRYIREHN